MLAFSIHSSEIRNNIFIPSYYDPTIERDLRALESSHNIVPLSNLIDDKIISVISGVEVGKMAYGTGDIPFVRTSDISNFEIKTIPKQGISEDEYNKYADKKSMLPEDILLVKDGTYLIGVNCVVSELDIPMLFQSHILRFRVNVKDRLHPYLLFLLLNASIVQRQIRNVQFTADIIDTIGTRYRELLLPIPKNDDMKDILIQRAIKAFGNRVKNKAVIKQFPLLMEIALLEGSSDAFSEFIGQPINEIKDTLIQDTTTLEFGSTIFFKMSSANVRNNIYLPKYYDPTIDNELVKLKDSCRLISVGELIKDKVIKIDTGDEIGKMAYGTGDIPFVRTSDFSNWELKSDPKQGISQEIFDKYASKQDVQAHDILMVRDGTYLVGTSCIVTEMETKMLYCGGLFKIRSLDTKMLNPYLLLGILNSYIVKRQIRTKQFTRDVIDTVGQRIYEIILPIPKDKSVADNLSQSIERIINSRFESRKAISILTDAIIAYGNESVGNDEGAAIVWLDSVTKGTER